jgi:hypothetical protein
MAGDRLVQTVRRSGCKLPVTCRNRRRACCSTAFEGVENNFVKETPCRCSAAPASSALRLKFEVGNQRPARQKEGQSSHARVVGDARYGAGCIDKRDIAHGELYTLIVLVDRRVARELKHCLVVVQIVEANISVGALESVRVATGIDCRETAHTQGAQPTGERVRIHLHHVVPPTMRA